MKKKLNTMFICVMAGIITLSSTLSYYKMMKIEKEKHLDYILPPDVQERIVEYQIEYDNFFESIYENKKIVLKDELIYNIELVEKCFPDIPKFDYLNKLDDLKLLIMGATSDPSLGGYYDVRNNIMAVRSTDAFLHETIHLMASKFYDGKLIYDGYYQHNEETTIGYGLNEGVTDMITREINGYTDTVYGYPYESGIIKLLCEIVDPYVIAKNFFGANLEAFIDELAVQTGSRETALFIVRDLDTVNNNGFLFRQSAQKELQTLLVDAYIHKTTEDIENGMDLDSVLDSLAKFGKTFSEVQDIRFYFGKKGVTKYFNNGRNDLLELISEKYGVDIEVLEDKLVNLAVMMPNNICYFVQKKEAQFVDGTFLPQYEFLYHKDNKAVSKR